MYLLNQSAGMCLGYAGYFLIYMKVTVENLILKEDKVF
jgi:hypothetical protein